MLPKFYAIVDQTALDAAGMRLSSFAGEMARAGVTMVQLRDKRGTVQAVLESSRRLSAAFEHTQAILVMNDRADLAALAGWSAVHVGHTDMPPGDARAVLPGDDRMVGVSTHNDAQVSAAASSCADYIAVGPVFRTSSKADAEPVVGLEGVRRARALTCKPLVAIGGITRENARSVMDAGADCVAVIGGLFVRGERPGKVAQEFLALLGE